MTRNDRRSTAFLRVLCVISVLALSGLSRAAENDEAGARVLFAEGRKLVDAGDYALACAKFEDSFRLDPGIGTNFNLADCLEHIGRTASAWTRFLEVAAATRAAGQPERERVARARASALEPKLARLTVAVSTPVPGLVVARDGVSIKPAAWGSSVPIDPGEHLVEATAPGKEKWSQVAWVPNAATSVSVLVPALVSLPPDPPPPAAPTTPAAASLVSPAPRGEPARRASKSDLALGAVGAVALVTSAIFGLKVRSENGEAMGLCPTNKTCDSLDEKMRHDELVSVAYRDRNVAFVSAAVGGAALLTAAYLWWRSPRVSTRPLGGSHGASLEVDW